MLMVCVCVCVQDGTPTTKTFEHVASEIGAEEAEEVGVEHLLRLHSLTSSNHIFLQKLSAVYSVSRTCCHTNIDELLISTV